MKIRLSHPVFLILFSVFTFVGSNPASAQEFTPFLDLYNFGGWKAFSSRLTSNYSVWDRIEHDCSQKMNPEMMEAFRFMPKTSQADFRGLIKSRAPVTVVTFGSMPKAFLRSRIFKASEVKYALACVTGMFFQESVAYVEDFDYFEDFLSYYNFLKNQRNEVYPSMGLNNTFMLIRNQVDFKSALETPDKLGVVLTLTGGHVLGNSVFLENNLTTTEGYRRLIMKNIDKIKGAKPIMDNTDFFLDHPILYFSLASTFDNGIVGSARLQTKRQEALFGTQTNEGVGFSSLGQEVVEALLSNKNGNRILIDVSHMSLDARKQYYAYVRDLRKEGENIPIVASHVGISGLNWDSPAYKAPDDELKNLESFLNHWKMNLSQQDIQNIIESNGIIGIPIHLQKLCGPRFFAGLREWVPGSAQEKEWYVQAFLANVFTAVQAYDKAEAWDHLAVGTEFDRIAPSFRPYETADQMQRFMKDIIRYLERQNGIFDLFKKEDIERLSFGLSPQEIVHKLFYANSAHFIENNLPE